MVGRGFDAEIVPGVAVLLSNKARTRHARPDVVHGQGGSNR